MLQPQLGVRGNLHTLWLSPDRHLWGVLLGLGVLAVLPAVMVCVRPQESANMGLSISAALQALAAEKEGGGGGGASPAGPARGTAPYSPQPTACPPCVVVSPP